MEPFLPHHRHPRHIARRGFTLIELVVVLVIITIITGVVLTSQGTFNKSLTLANTAYDIALTIRSAETFGLGSRAIPGGVVNAGYGLHFGSETMNSFTLFADTHPTTPCERPDCNKGDHVYTSGSDFFVQKYMLGNGITLSKFCAYATTWTCSPEISWLDIVFERPNPNAFMAAENVSGTITQSCITLVAPTSLPGEGRHILIHRSGQIIADAESCGPS